MIKTNRTSHIVCEQQAKFVQERIVRVEKNFAELCTLFGAYTRKIAGMRDKTDELVKALSSYAESENVNLSLKSGLNNFSTTLASVGDHQDAMIQRSEKKIVNELSQYEGICKHAREEVKSTFSARDRELVRKRQLDRIQERNPRNRQMITLAESELLKASAEVSRTMKGLEEQMDVFEKKKLQDIKSIMMDFAMIQISFHAKAIELFTLGYQQVQGISVEDDLEEFRDALRVPESKVRLDTVKRASFRSTSSLGSLANLFTTPPRFRRSSEARVPPSSLKEQDKKSHSVDSLKKGLGDSSESVEVEDFLEDESSYESDEEDNRNPINYQRKT